MALEDAIEEAIQRHEVALEGLWSLIRSTRNDAHLTTDERRDLLTRLYAPLSVKDVREFFVNDGAAYGIGVSFRSSMSHLMKVKAGLRREGLRIAPGANSKLKDRSFGSNLGIPVPETRQFGVALREVVTVPRSIIKPVSGAGARSVMFVDSQGIIRSIKTGTRYETLADAAEAEMPERTKSGEESYWIVEEAILGGDGLPANDLKVYMFYGKPGMVLEIARNQGERSETHYCTYDPNGNEIDLGPTVKTFSGSGLPPDVIDKARRISLASPVPFLRVDFHYGATGRYLGEITPHPGGTYAGDLYDPLDKRLGRLFIDAEARLYKDLINGKSFHEYFACYDPVVRK